MGRFQIFWDYTRKKNGDILIAEKELQKMLDTAESNGYNAGYMDGLKSTQEKTINFNPGQIPVVTHNAMPGCHTGGYQVTAVNTATTDNNSDISRSLTTEEKEQMVRDFEQNVNGK